MNVYAIYELSYRDEIATKYEIYLDILANVHYSTTNNLGYFQ